MAIQYVTSIDDYKKLKQDNENLIEAFKERADNFLCFEHVNKHLIPKKMMAMDSRTMWTINLPSFGAKKSPKKCPVMDMHCARI